MSKFRCPDSHVHVKLLTLICRGRFISSSRIFPILLGRQRQRRCLESSGSQIPYCGPGVKVCRIPAEGDSHQCVIIIGLFSMLGRAFCSYCLQINLALSRIALFHPQYFNKLGEIPIRCHLRLIRLCFQLLSNILYQLTAQVRLYALQHHRELVFGPTLFRQRSLHVAQGQHFGL